MVAMMRILQRRARGLPILMSLALLVLAGCFPDTNKQGADP
jgi:hypothetical protein